MSLCPGAEFLLRAELLGQLCVWPRRPPEWWSPCAPWPAVQGTPCSVSSQHLALSGLNFCPSGWCVVKSHCRFHVHFPGFLKRSSIFCTFMGSLCFQGRELPLAAFRFFFCRLFTSVLSPHGRACVLDTNFLSGACGSWPFTVTAVSQLVLIGVDSRPPLVPVTSRPPSCSHISCSLSGVHSSFHCCSPYLMPRPPPAALPSRAALVSVDTCTMGLVTRVWPARQSGGCG